MVIRHAAFNAVAVRKGEHKNWLSRKLQDGWVLLEQTTNAQGILFYKVERKT